MYIQFPQQPQRLYVFSLRMLTALADVGTDMRGKVKKVTLISTANGCRLAPCYKFVTSFFRPLRNVS